MSKRIIAMLLALALIVGCFAACGNDSGKNSSAAGNTSSTAGGESSAGGEENSEPSNVSTGADDTSEHYDFTCYWYYDWAGIKKWGAYNFSKYMGEKFNVTVTFSKPDADADSKLQLMLTGGSLPDSMILDRGRVLNSVARAGALVEIEQFMYPGCTFETDITDMTRDLLRVDGKLYTIPNWPRAEGKASTGGNEQWIVNTYVYEKLGKPALNTLEDIHQYALKAKELADSGETTYSGQSIIPMAATNNNTGFSVYRPFFRALGARNIVENYFTQEDAKINLGVFEPKFVEALKIANQWYNEGLWSSDIFTDDGDMWVEKMTNGRPAIFWYDFSQDDTNNYRRKYVEESGKTDKAGAYEIIGSATYDELGKYPQFPAADGVEVVYGDEAGSPGWNVNVITTAAKRPQRIFDLFTWMISKEGSYYQVLGGPDGPIWNGEFEEDGTTPKLLLDYGAITSAQQDEAGAWMYTQPAHSDYIDTMKFALNDKSETKNWTVYNQAHVSTYDIENPKIGQKFKTDQSTNVLAYIDPQSDLGISLKAIQDQCQSQLPQIMMAPDEATFNKLIDDLKAFCESNNLAGVLEEMQRQYDANIEQQGFDAYSEDYDVYKLKG